MSITHRLSGNSKLDKKLITIACGPGKTEQAHKDQCDINYILKDYTRTGLIRHANQHEGQYDDVTAIDFQNAAFTVARVKSLFEGLPSGS